LTRVCSHGDAGLCASPPPTHTHAPRPSLCFSPRTTRQCESCQLVLRLRKQEAEYAAMLRDAAQGIVNHDRPWICAWGGGGPLDSPYRDSGAKVHHGVVVLPSQRTGKAGGWGEEVIGVVVCGHVGSSVCVCICVHGCMCAWVYLCTCVAHHSEGCVCGAVHCRTAAD
jgi:hypothetical protein